MPKYIKQEAGEGDWAAFFLSCNPFSREAIKLTSIVLVLCPHPTVSALSLLTGNVVAHTDDRSVAL